MMEKMKASGADDTKISDTKRKNSKEETKIDLEIQTNGDVLDTEEISQGNQYTFTPSTRAKTHTVEEIAENVNKNISDIYGKDNSSKSGNVEP